jgi:hypothetical protein
MTTNLPTLDEWIEMRAKLVTVLGDQPAATLLSLFPNPVDGGFATNVRVDLMEQRIRADMAELRTEIALASAENLKAMRALFFQLVGVMCTLGGFAIAAAKLL